MAVACQEGSDTKSAVIEKLREISFLSSMTDSDLQQIAEIITERHYEKGSVIIEEKTKAERFFIIHRGKIEISKHFEGGEKAVLSIQSDGAFFGEMAMLDEGRRSATVLALDPTTVLEIRKDDFDTLLFKAPILAYHILRELSARLRETGALLVTILTQKNSQLYHAYIDTMNIFLQAMERRNALTSGRSRRLTELCMALGREMKVGEDELPFLELSSLLHDLGMLSISDKVLEKAGPLSAPEYDVIKQHTLNCIDMIGSIPLLQRIVPVIQHHHEHFDGSGYPDGLAGERIPLLSRILAVADAYESMIDSKAYRESKSEEKAREEIVRYSGSQFDPGVVDAFLKVLGSGGRKRRSSPQANKGKP
jgi:HD-GYP domain-containing protein (c-di-GMP phosphodiesterase class II)